MDQFKHKFVNEANELLVKIENSLIDLENNSESKESIHEIFRAMHTLKGISVMFGFDKIGELTHYTESIFDKIREGTVVISNEIVEFTLESVDHIKNLLKDEAFVELGNHKNHDRLLKTIQKILQISEDQKITPKIKSKKDKTNIGICTYYIAFEPDERMLERGISLFSLFNELAGLGRYEIVDLSTFTKDGDNREMWGVYLASNKSVNDILDVFIFVEDNVKVVKLSNDNLLENKHSENKIDINPKSDIIDPAIKLTEEYTAARIQKTVIEATSEIDNTKEEHIHHNTSDTTLKNEQKNMSVSDEHTCNDTGKDLSRILVDSFHLDKLMYLVSELVTTKARLRMVEETKNYALLTSVVEKVEDLSHQFRDNVLEIRLVPIVDLLIPFKRLIRDVSKKLNKKVNFITNGVETKLDKHIIDKLGDPLMHIIRNSIDHGIETPQKRLLEGKSEEGNIKLSSYYAGSNVIIKIEDDGAGLDLVKIKEKALSKGLIDSKTEPSEKELFNLIFHPGFSTAEKITDISGRGVGMDVVKKTISEVQGEIFIESEYGKGTTITIKLKQTISITDSLLMKVEDTSFIVPLSDVLFCYQKENKELIKTKNTRVEINDELLPYILLRDKFKIGGEYPEKQKLVIVQSDDKKVALVVDRIVGEHQAVLKPLGDMFNNQEYFSGVSVLGDGTLAIMLDTTLLINYIYEQTKDTKKRKTNKKNKKNE